MDQERLQKGLYWDRAWSLVSGCSPVSPGCDNCWAAAEAAGEFQTQTREGEMIELVVGLLLLSGVLALAVVISRAGEDEPCSDCNGFNGDKILCREHCQSLRYFWGEK